MRERSVDVVLKDSEDPNDTPERASDEARERLFYVNWQAPDLVILIGFGLYFLLGISFYSTMSSEHISILNTATILRLIVILVFYFVFAVLIDGIIKGKVFSRAAYTGLTALSVIYKLVLVFISPVFYMPSYFEIVFTFSEILLLALLFIEPSSSWFVGEKERDRTDDLLDDM